VCICKYVYVHTYRVEANISSNLVFNAFPSLSGLQKQEKRTCTYICNFIIPTMQNMQLSYITSIKAQSVETFESLKAYLCNI